METTFQVGEEGHRLAKVSFSVAVAGITDRIVDSNHSSGLSLVQTVCCNA